MNAKLLVLGHTGCGAISGAINNGVQLGNLTGLEQQGKIAIAGAMYDLSNGAVHFLG